MEKIVDLLADGPLSTGSIMQELGVTRPTALAALNLLFSERRVIQIGSNPKDPTGRWALPSADISRVRTLAQPPNLLERIDSTLAQIKLNPALFERFACFLLSESFPTLSPVTGGTDYGRDADVPQRDQDPIRVVITTAQDGARNLRESLARLNREGESLDEVIFASSQPLSATNRRDLREAASRKGARLVAIYDRTWLANGLYRNPEWRKLLIGVTGQPSAFIGRPLELADRTWGMLPLIGREAELKLINSATEDFILSGEPGSGKTRIAAEIHQVLFLDRTDDISRLADDLRVSRPAVVVVDNAHSNRNMEVIGHLRKLRHEEPLHYRLVLTTWPDKAEQVAELLPAEVVNLKPLERAQMGALLREMGINNHYFLAEIIRQAQGRPGWAISLGEIAIEGNAKDLFSGQALFKQVERYLLQVGRSDEQIDLLARVSALGGLPETDIARLADQLKQPEATVIAWLNSATANGVIELRGDIWRTFPERLRQGLVARWFFDGRPAANFSALIGSWPERRNQLIHSAVEAAGLGSARAASFCRNEVARLIEESDDPHSQEVVGILGDYAMLDTGAAEWTLGIVSRLINGWARPSRPEDASAWSSFSHSYYQEIGRWKGIVGLLSQIAERWLLPQSLDLLIQVACQDDSEPHRDPDHPLRCLTEMPTKFKPLVGTNFEARKAILNAALRLICTRSDERAGKIAADLAAASLSPRGAGHWMDPESHNRVVLTESIEGPPEMKRIEAELWPLWVDAFEALPVSGVKKTLRLVQDWLRLGQGHGAAFGGSVDEASSVLAKRVGRRMLKDLRSTASLTPSMSQAWNEISAPVRIGPKIPVDPLFELLTFDPWFRQDDRQQAYADRTETLRKLANAWASEDPKKLLQSLIELRRQAHLISRTGLFWLAYRHLAEAVGDPALWAQSAVDCGVCEDQSAIGQIFIAAVSRQPQYLDKWLPDALGCSMCRGPAITACLSSGSPQAVERGLHALSANDRFLVRSLVWRTDETERLVHSLLTHPAAEIRAETALHCSFDDDGEGASIIPKEWFADWSNAFRDVVGLDLDNESRHMLSRTLKRLVAVDPEVCAKWFKSFLDHEQVVYRYHSTDFLSYARDLPRQYLLEILEHADKGTFRRELVEAALHDDPSWAIELLDDNRIDPREALATISFDKRGSYFETLAPILVDRGLAPVSIADRLEPTEWMGPQSAYLQTAADYCAELAQHLDSRLAAVGILGARLFQRRLEEALAEEHREKVFGY